MFRTIALALTLLATGIAPWLTNDHIETTRITAPGTGEIDVFRPSGDEVLPIVVMLHGGGNKGNAEMHEIARAVAADGAVVFAATYDSSQPRSKEAVVRTFHESLCAVRHARVVADDFSADANRLVLVGFSYGGLPASGLARTPDGAYDADCHRGVSHVPSAMVGLAGAYYYDWRIQNLWGSEDASHLTSAGRLGADVPSIILHGTRDANVPIDHAIRHHRILDQAGVAIGFESVDTRHAEFVDPSTPAGTLAVETIIAATAGDTFTGTRGVDTAGASPWARRAEQPSY